MQAIDELARRVDEADQDAEDELPAEAALDAKDLAFLRASSQIFAIEKLEAQARADEAQRLLEEARVRSDRCELARARGRDGAPLRRRRAGSHRRGAMTEEPNHRQIQAAAEYREEAFGSPERARALEVLEAMCDGRHGLMEAARQAAIAQGN